MGPRSGERGRPGVPPVVPRRNAASMGPRSGERGRTGDIYMDEVGRIPLQWGRAPESAEGHKFFQWDDAAAAASMGPRSGERGRLLACRISVVLIQKASMGPRSGERGRPRESWARLGEEERLQWGRAPESAEGMTTARKRTASRKGFNGAALRRARKDLGIVVDDRILLLLQWGRAPESAEGSPVKEARARLKHPASMGPRSGERGRSAQMQELASAIQSFNGAALRRARKGRTTAPATFDGSRSFNGAALRRARKDR